MGTKRKAPEPKEAKPYSEPGIVNLVYNGEFVSWHPRYKTTKIALAVMRTTLFGHTSPAGFVSCIFHSKDPKSTVHIYPNGKFTVCGARTSTDALILVRATIYQVMKKTKIILSIYNFRLDNTVITYKTGYLIDLDKLFEAVQAKATYGLYCGVQYYPNGFHNRRPCIVVHESGAVNVTAAGSHAAAVAELDKLELIKYKQVPIYRLTN